MTDSGEPSASIDSFIEAIGQISDGRRRLPSLAVGDVIASRYHLVRELGRGANGVVWQAHDEIVRKDVGVKLLVASARDHAARARTEVASLRRLRLPGVAHLLDEGSDGDFTFLVMPIVRGARFPGRPLPVPWEDLVRSAELLLETLGRVHSTGIIHRDLKPANVLVDDDGRPTLLDFGLSIVAGFGDLEHRGGLTGTPAYLAPEQLLDEPVDARADLYAVGVMLYHALSGTFPHEVRDLRALRATKTTAPLPLRTVAPQVPEEVASAVDTLLATRPEDRPSSATKARGLLLGHRESPPVPILWLEESHDPSTPFTIDELKQLFAGLDRLSWVRSDGARLLQERTSGEPSQVRAVVAAWVRTGRCRWEPGGERRLVIDREALDELQGDLWANVSSREGAFVDNALGVARSLAERGRLGNAIVALHEALVSLRRAPDAERRERVLSLWVEIALGEGTPHALDRVLYEICRSTSPSETERQLESLVRAALAVGAWSARASDLAEAIPPFSQAGLEVRRLGVRVLAARRDTLEREEAVVDTVVRIAEQSDDPRLRSSAAGWLGKLRYRQGHYGEATRLQLDAANLATWRTERIAATLHAASSTLEAFDEERAIELARLALDEATESRNAYLAGRAEWLVRSASYRLGRDHRVDDELLAEARRLGAPDLFGMISLVEAAHAYRARDARAATLAGEAYEAWASAGEPIASLLAGSLAIANGWPLPQQTRDRLRMAAWVCDVPGIGVQAAALLCQGGAPVPDRHVRHRLASTVPKERWARRMEILSVDEALALIGP